MLAGVLVALDEASGSEQAMARVRLAPGRHARRVAPDEWSQLTHPELDAPLSQLFAALWPAVLSIKGKRDREVGLDARYLASPGESALPFVRIFHATAHRLGVPPRLFLRTDVQGGLVHMPVWPLASLCGATVLESFGAPELAFICATHCASYLAQLYVLTLAPARVELTALACAGLRIAGLTPAERPEIESIAQQLAPRIQPLQVEHLQAWGARLRVRAAPSVCAALEHAAERWRRAAWLTTNRVGVALAPDLPVALRMIRARGPVYPGADVRDAEDDVLRFALTQRYALLVRTLTG